MHPVFLRNVQQITVKQHVMPFPNCGAQSDNYHVHILTVSVETVGQALSETLERQLGSISQQGLARAGTSSVLRCSTTIILYTERP